MPDLTSQLAEAIGGPNDSPTATLRIATVTAVESSGSFRVQTDATADAWLSRDADTLLTVGDKVWILQQGGVWLIGGRLNGGAATPVGVVNPYAGASAPAGWLICNGQAVSRTTYAALFAVCGTTYGTGDGSTTFNVPDLRGKFPVGSTAAYPRGDVGGSTAASIGIANMPSHNHGSVGDHNHGSAGSHQHGYTGYATGDRTLTGSPTKIAVNSPQVTDANGDHTHAGDGGHAHTMQGSGQAIDTMPPYTSLAYIIRAL